MARRSTRGAARVELNRRNLTRLGTYLGDGALKFAQTVVDAVPVWDAEPYGVGLVERGASAAWVNGRKIGGEATTPRGARVRERPVVAVGGFSFPARFKERGTTIMPADPRLDPTLASHAPKAGAIFASAVRPRMGGPDA